MYIFLSIDLGIFNVVGARFHKAWSRIHNVGEVHQKYGMGLVVLGSLESPRSISETRPTFWIHEGLYSTGPQGSLNPSCPRSGNGAIFTSATLYSEYQRK
jgi:hypothetical protein